ncbi:MAG TPA: hypothetical protein VMF58_16715 [Rhizomicrobium sp.]|nr:hypothetical protein [Rhizomicrobium sp.]
MHFFGTGVVSSVLVIIASVQASSPEKIPQAKITGMHLATTEDILKTLRRMRAEMEESDHTTPSQSP